VVVTGDFFTRFSPFFIEGVRDLYTASGIILKPVDLADLVLYGAYDGIAGTANTWGMKPGNLALGEGVHAHLPAGRQGIPATLARLSGAAAGRGILPGNFSRKRSARGGK